MNPSNPTSALLVASQMLCPLTESCLGAPALYVLSLWLAVTEIHFMIGSKLTVS
jgi:hypothetical protein